MVSLLSLFVSLVGAVEGHFSYQNQLQVVSSIRYENVYTSTAEGKARMTELKNQGYSCQYKSPFMQCKFLFDTVTDIPTAVSSRLPSAQDVLFGPEDIKELQTQGDTVSIYESQQDVTVDGTRFDKVKYLFNGDLEKATVGDANTPESYHSFIVETDAIAVLDSVHVTESQWAFSIYAVKYTLPKN